MTQRYRTIARTTEAELEVKRSRFRCTLTRVADEAAARDAVAAARAQYWDGRHHCSAFILGSDGSCERSNDDGEPAGTAGAPMLDVLRGEQLSDVVAVVTRWFGGTLLGAGGLVRAYSDAVRAAVEQAPIQHRQLLTEFAVTLGHDRAGRFEAGIRSRGIAVLNVDYASTVTFQLGTTDPEGFYAQVEELTAGAAESDLIQTSWVDI